MTSNLTDSNCRFCQLLRENKIFVYRDDLVSVFLDKDPISKGHLLIIPNNHYLDIDKVPFSILNRMMKLIQATVSFMREEYQAPGYSLMQNGGIFNDIGHFHIHLFPRYSAEQFGWSYSEEHFPELNQKEKTIISERLQRSVGLQSNDFPERHTKRLILNELQYDDVDKIAAYVGDPSLSSTTLNIPFPYTRQDAFQWITQSKMSFKTKSKIPFAIRDLTGELIGSIALHINQRFDRANTGYWIGKPFWNLGYATEALSSVLEFAFYELKLNKVVAQHLAENLSSGKVMIKNGMIQEGELKAHTKKGEVYRDVIQYRLTKDEYDAYVREKL